MFDLYDDLMTADDACEALKIGKKTLYGLLNRHELKGYRNGRIWRIPKEALMEYVKAQAKL